MISDRNRLYIFWRSLCEMRRRSDVQGFGNACVLVKQALMDMPGVLLVDFTQCWYEGDLSRAEIRINRGFAPERTFQIQESAFGFLWQYLTAEGNYLEA